MNLKKLMKVKDMAGGNTEYYYDFSVLKDDEDKMNDVVDNVIEIINWYNGGESDVVDTYDDNWQEYFQRYQSQHPNVSRDIAAREASMKALQSILPSEDEMYKMLSDYSASYSLSEAFDEFFKINRVNNSREDSDPFDRYDFGPWTR